MAKNLVIVESPAKAKTIEQYLGKDYLVKSSYGHVRDLPKGNKAIDIENGFLPSYVVSEDKKQVIKELKSLSEKAELVWLATDDDREGEAISWHLKEALDLNDRHMRRIVFREITKNAILNAISSPRGIDIDLVNAQQARRVLDRLVGFELSPILWRKVKSGLSAGRVQSVAVRLVVEREREISAFSPTSAYKVSAHFLLEGGQILIAHLPKKISDKASVSAFLEKCKAADFHIEKLETKPAKKSPAAPFTTSTLQQEASRKLGFSVAQTMIVAQKLYEAGHITYMRTDSVTLSKEAVGAALQQIKTNYGEAYMQARTFKTKSKSAQEAHEAIRPTSFAKVKIQAERNEIRLYELIWKRAIASQMADARLEKTTATIKISSTKEKLLAKGEVVKFDGFLKVYIESLDDEEQREKQDGSGSNILPPLSEGQLLNMQEMSATERFTRPPFRYTEASLVKKMEELGIGRPSTYAPTISTILKRNYVLKESREGKARKYFVLTLRENEIKEVEKSEIFGAEKYKLFPTDEGMVVNDFLHKYFAEIIDYSFTANVEEKFDEIARGKEVWNKMLEGFYGDFHKTVEETYEKADRSAAGAVRELGNDPKTGKPVFAKLGKLNYGSYVQLGSNEDEEKPRYAPLRHGQHIHTITLEDALELFKLPRTVGTFEELEVVAAIGRFGPYLRHDGKFVSLGKLHDPLTVNIETAIRLIQEKREADAKKTIKTFEEEPELKVLNGRWGPYISFKKTNYKVPKDLEAEKLTLEECKKIIETAPPKRKRATKKKTTAAKKSTTTKKKTTTTKKATTTKKKNTATKKSATAKKATTTAKK